MAHPGWKQERAPVPSKRNAGYRNEDAGVVHDETERRKEESVAAATPAQQASAGTNAASAPLLAPANPPPPPPIIDRHHKEAINEAGGYIYAALDHDKSEGDQMPPTNPAYRGAGTLVSSIADAYAFALSRLSILRAGARISIIPIAGSWNEPHLNIAVPGIDFLGHGQPKITGQWTFGQADTMFRGIDFIAPDALQGSHNVALSPTGIPSYYNCRFYSDGVSMYTQRPTYLEGCEFWQTSNAYGLSEQYVPLIVEMLPPWTQAMVLKGCALHAWKTLPDSTTDPLVPGGRVSLDAHPGGFAIKAYSNVTGPYGSNDITGGATYEWPGQQVTLIDCDVYGSALIDSWMLEYIGGHVHGAFPIASRSGTVHAVLRGRPLFDSVNGWYGYAPGHVAFDGTTIHAEAIAAGLPYTGFVPPGAPPGTTKGAVYAQVSNSPHMGRWDGGAASAFEPTSVVGFADVTNSPTSAASWLSGGWSVAFDATSPVAVRANRRFYMM